jgi:hypothetical protein
MSAGRCIWTWCAVLTHMQWRSMPYLVYMHHATHVHAHAHAHSALYEAVLACAWPQDHDVYKRRLDSKGVVIPDSMEKHKVGVALFLPSSTACSASAGICTFCSVH